MPHSTTSTNPESSNNGKTAMENFLNAVFGKSDPSTIAIPELIDRFVGSPEFKAILEGKNAISADAAMRLIDREPSVNESAIAELFGDKTKAVAALNFSSDLPLSIVHSVLVNLGNWKVGAIEMNPSNGNLFVALYRNRFGYAVYLIGPDGSGVPAYTKFRAFLTEDEAIEYGDAAAKHIAETAWKIVERKPKVDWLEGTCRDSDEFGFVHEGAFPGGSISIKILRA